MVSANKQFSNFQTPECTYHNLYVRKIRTPYFLETCLINKMIYRNRRLVQMANGIPPSILLLPANIKAIEPSSFDILRILQMEDTLHTTGTTKILFVSDPF